MPPILHTTAQALLAGVIAQLAECGAEPVARSGVVHGTPVFDECCDGMLWVRWASQFLTDTFPTESEEAVHCSALVIAARYEVGILRCVPVLQQTGIGGVKLPTAAELEESALELATDAAALLAGVYATLAAFGRARRYSVGAMEPVEAQGQCGGSLMTVTVELA